MLKKPDLSNCAKSSCGTRQSLRSGSSTQHINAVLEWSSGGTFVCTVRQSQYTVFVLRALAPQIPSSTLSFRFGTLRQSAALQSGLRPPILRIRGGSQSFATFTCLEQLDDLLLQLKTGQNAGDILSALDALLAVVEFGLHEFVKIQRSGESTSTRGWTYSPEFKTRVFGDTWKNAQQQDKVRVHPTIDCKRPHFSALDVLLVSSVTVLVVSLPVPSTLGFDGTHASSCSSCSNFCVKRGFLSVRTAAS
eukprot:3464565-Rhodomonas_salina.2